MNEVYKRQLIEQLNKGKVDIQIDRYERRAAEINHLVEKIAV